MAGYRVLFVNQQFNRGCGFLAVATDSLKIRESSIGDLVRVPFSFDQVPMRQILQSCRETIGDGTFRPGSVKLTQP